MQQTDLSRLSLQLRALTVFRRLRQDPVVAALDNFLQLRAQNADPGVLTEAYAAFAAKLYDCAPEGLGSYVAQRVYEDENAYIRCVGNGGTPCAPMREAVTQELSTLQTVIDLSPQQLTAGLPIPLPGFLVTPVNLSETYADRVAHIRQTGYGIYASWRMFRLNETGGLTPVRHPDPIRLSDLIGYERERRQVLDNTRALLAGKPAANLLLTGDAGTGKSSTIKAVVNELYPQGLRIIEVRKEQLCRIPALLDALTGNPLCFILFIDDLSFAKDDDQYNALKAVLEGSVAAKSQNVAIYATSNRRHLMKERASDREGDDMHVRETMQEILSLSERFGLRITFQRPDRETYLAIVRELARARGLSADLQLEADAERYALQRGGCSPRAAKQFVDSRLADFERS